MVTEAIGAAVAVSTIGGTLLCGITTVGIGTRPLTLSQIGVGDGSRTFKWATGSCFLSSALWVVCYQELDGSRGLLVCLDTHLESFPGH